MTDLRFRQAFLLLLVAAISLAFLAMVRAFLLTIFLAAIFAGMSRPLYRWTLARCRGHEALAAAGTLALLLVLVLAPLAIVLGAGANEALRISQSFGPQLQAIVAEPGGLEAWLRTLPFYRIVEPYQGQIVSKAGELVTGAGAFLFDALSATTLATATFLFHFVVLLYTMFFLLTSGPRLLASGLAYVPLDDADKARMLERFTSVTRATLRGTVFIGAAQGLLSGLAFWVVGIDGAIFWGTVMTVLSIIPGVGGALVWVPAVVVLVVTGHLWQGIGLAGFCAFVVGSVDNVLRPKLVGRDTQLHELFIFFSTLGGLMLFGVMGFVVGPILAALFVTVWEMFGVAFRHELTGSPPVAASAPASADAADAPPIAVSQHVANDQTSQP